MFKYYLGTSVRPNIIFDLIEELFNIEQTLNTNDDLIIITKDPPNNTLLRNSSTIMGKR